MILVTLKLSQGGPRIATQDRILQINPDAIESMQDLSAGGCRLWLRGVNDGYLEVEENVNDIAIASYEQNNVVSDAIKNVNRNAMEAFERMARMMGWSVLALVAIAVLMVLLVVMR